MSQGLLQGTVVQGHRVASGMAADCPWPGGSVARQLPLMAAYGLDVSRLFPGTLNVRLDSGEAIYPDDAAFDFVIDWRAPDRPTHFRLHRLELSHTGGCVEGWTYRKIYPAGYVSLHPIPCDVIEVLAQRIDGIGYGSRVGLRFL